MRRLFSVMILATSLPATAYPAPHLEMVTLIDGIVRYRDVEGGCWVIESGKRVFEPVNLAPAMKKEGLRVLVKLKPFDGGTICMVGTPVEIEYARKKP